METTNKEVVKIITKPQDFKFLEANRIVREDHVRSIMHAIERNEYLPPILVTKNNYIVDGQNRYSAFLNLCKTNKKVSLRVLIINSDEDPVQLAIKLNSNRKRWTGKDYFHAYLSLDYKPYAKLAKFMTLYPELSGIEVACQLLKGSYATKTFQLGGLQISDNEILVGEDIMRRLHKVYSILKDDRVFKRCSILAFYTIYHEMKDWMHFYENLSYFKMPNTLKSSDWLKSYQDCLWFWIKLTNFARK